MHENKEKNEQMFAAIIKELTGDWVTGVDCRAIQGQNRWHYDEVVFFGDAEDLQEGGIASMLN